MITITEDYVSFETAKLLKEKGFPQNPNICNTAYTFRGKLSNNAKSFVHNDAEFDKLGIKPLTYSMAPTLQMAMKWLREVHKLEITPFHEMFQGNSWWYRIERNTSLSLIVEYEEDSIYGSYEQAAETALKYCLENLI